MTSTSLPRRKGPKRPPSLPLSAFTPPNSGTSDRFPLPPSPSTVHPDNVVDAHVVGDPTLAKWQKEAAEILGTRVRGVVLSVQATEAEEILKELETHSSRDKIISLIISFSLDDPASISAATGTSVAASLPSSFSTIFAKSTPESIAALRQVLQKGRPVDIEIQTSMTDASLEGFEDFLTKATAELPAVPPIVLSNLLPPPHDLNLPIVKLMNHPTYYTFQKQVAALSLFPSVYVKYLPPVWGASTPSTPLPSGAAAIVDSTAGSKEQREWKRRIRMYLGPVVEAFGFQRIIFGTSPPAASQVPSNCGDWYNVARESLAELGVEQESIDSVFALNAQRVYGK